MCDHNHNNFNVTKFLDGAFPALGKRCHTLYKSDDILLCLGLLATIFLMN